MPNQAEIVETPTCPICEIKIDDSDGPAPADDGVTEANLRDECSICHLKLAQAWAGATGKTEAEILAEYDEIRGALGSDSQQPPEPES